jgi:hypothetical protein
LTSSELSVAQHTLQHRLTDIPESTSSHIKVGFALLPKLSADQLRGIVSYVISNLSKRTRYDPDVAAEISGVDKQIVGDMLSAIALTVGAVFDIEVSKEDFFRLAPAGLIDDQSVPFVELILGEAIDQRDQIKADFERSKVANAILPSFRSIELSVDIRLKFDDDDNIIDKVPLALFYIATDLDDEIVFQASSADIEDLIKKLESAKHKIAKAAS